MTNLGELYKCDICSNVVEIVHNSYGSLICCNQEMRLLKENNPSSDNAHFAHIECNGVDKKIKYNHPMTQEHYIEFIEVNSNDMKYKKRKYLKPNEPCEMEFKCVCNEGFFTRLYCNKDEMWVNR